MMPAETIDILFVCTGNTCRSPMAEALFRQKAEGRSLTYQFSSAGISARKGAPVSEHTKTVLLENSIPLSTAASQPATTALLQRADYIFCMSPHHLSAITQQYPEAREKVFLIGEFLDAEFPVEIVDPYGGPLEEYRAVRQQLEQAVLPIFETIEQYHVTPPLEP